MTNDGVAGLHFRASKTGSVRMDSDLGWSEFKDIYDDLGGEAEGRAVVSKSTEVWAGPYEIYLSIQPIFDSTTGLIGAGTGIAALFIELFNKHPEQPINIHVDNSKTIVINGDVNLSDEDLENLARFFQQNDKDPNDPTWRVAGAGE
jgi:hypothetical protein